MMWMRWVFLLTQLGILIALCLGAVMMWRLNRKLDRDQADRDLLRGFLMKNSDQAVADAQAVDPEKLRDRRVGMKPKTPAK